MPTIRLTQFDGISPGRSSGTANTHALVQGILSDKEPGLAIPAPGEADLATSFGTIAPLFFVASSTDAGILAINSGDGAGTIQLMRSTDFATFADISDASVANTIAQGMGIISTSGGDNVFIADAATQIHRYQATGDVWTANWQGTNGGPMHLFSKNGKLYVINLGGNSLHSIDSTPTFVAAAVSFSRGEGGYAISEHGNLVAAGTFSVVKGNQYALVLWDTFTGTINDRIIIPIQHVGTGITNGDISLAFLNHKGKLWIFAGPFLRLFVYAGGSSLIDTKWQLPKHFFTSLNDNVGVQITQAMVANYMNGVVFGMKIPKSWTTGNPTPDSFGLCRLESDEQGMPRLDTFKVLYDLVTDPTSTSHGVRALLAWNDNLFMSYLDNTNGSTQKVSRTTWATNPGTGIIETQIFSAPNVERPDQHMAIRRVWIECDPLPASTSIAIAYRTERSTGSYSSAFLTVNTTDATYGAIDFPSATNVTAAVIREVQFKITLTSSGATSPKLRAFCFEYDIVNDG